MSDYNAKKYDDIMEKIKTALRETKTARRNLNEALDIVRCAQDDIDEAIDSLLDAYGELENLQDAEFANELHNDPVLQIKPHPPEVVELTPEQIQDAKQRFSDAEERN